MDPDAPNNPAAAAEQGAAPPDAGASSTPPQPSEREKQLESQLTATTKERDKFKGQVGTLTTERDKLKGQVGTLTTDLAQAQRERDDYQAKYTAATTPTAAPEGATEPAGPAADADPHAETKALLKRNGLPCAYILPGGQVCFEKAHAQFVAGDAFDTLEVISAA